MGNMIFKSIFLAIQRSQRGSEYTVGQRIVCSTFYAKPFGTGHPHFPLMALTPRFPRRSANARKARLTFRTKKAGLSPHLFLREIYMGSIIGLQLSFLFPSSAIFSFSPFLPPHSDRTRMLGSLSYRVYYVVCAWVSLGDPTFSASGHPTHSLGLPIESQTLTLTL